MKKKVIVCISLFVLFIVYTILLTICDVKAIGPRDSTVGFSTINKFVHELFGEHMVLYNITDWAGFVPIVLGLGFAFVGLIQWIKRRNMFKVDSYILILGVFYLVVFGIYVMFNYIVINYRPVLINGYLEAAYPSSTTILTITFMITGIYVLNKLLKSDKLKQIIKIVFIVFTIIMVMGRLISGVHYFTDIVGAIIISVAMVLLYTIVCKCFEKK